MALAGSLDSEATICLHSSTTSWIWALEEPGEVELEPVELVEEELDLALVGVELPVVEEVEEEPPQPASRAMQERAASSIPWRRRHICRRVAYFRSWATR